MGDGFAVLKLWQSFHCCICSWKEGNKGCSSSNIGFTCFEDIVELNEGSDRKIVVAIPRKSQKNSQFYNYRNVQLDILVLRIQKDWILRCLSLVLNVTGGCCSLFLGSFTLVMVKADKEKGEMPKPAGKGKMRIYDALAFQVMDDTSQQFAVNPK